MMVSKHLLCIFFERQLKEINDNRSLQLYGCMLSLAHLLTAFFWRNTRISGEPYCWTFFQSCQEYSQFLHQHFSFFLILYAGCSILCALLFLARKNWYAYWLFFFLFILKFGIHISDFRMMGNYHYMHHVSVLLFLFFFNKTNCLRLMIVCFYVAAGMLKINVEWLSGAALLKPSPFNMQITQFLLFGVLYFEFFVVWFLLSSKKILFFSALMIALCFHAFSYFIVGYFYPLMMLCLLSIFILARDHFVFPKERVNVLVFSLFFLCQIYPLVFEPESSLNGQGRLVALNMLDASSSCETRYWIKERNQTIEYAPTFSNMAKRVHCDPLIMYYHVKKTCMHQKEKSDFIDLDIDHQIKRQSDEHVQVQMTFRNVCSRPLNVSILGTISQEGER